MFTLLPAYINYEDMVVDLIIPLTLLSLKVSGSYWSVSWSFGGSHFPLWFTSWPSPLLYLLTWHHSLGFHTNSHSFHNFHALPSFTSPLLCIPFSSFWLWCFPQFFLTLLFVSLYYFSWVVLSTLLASDSTNKKPLVPEFYCLTLVPFACWRLPGWLGRTSQFRLTITGR